MQGQGSSNINLSLYGSFFDVYRARPLSADSLSLSILCTEEMFRLDFRRSLVSDLRGLLSRTAAVIEPRKCWENKEDLTEVTSRKSQIKP